MQIAGVAEYEGTKLVIKGDQAKWFLLTFKLLELKIIVEEKNKSILYLKKVLDLDVQKNWLFLPWLSFGNGTATSSPTQKYLCLLSGPFLFTPALL